MLYNTYKTNDMIHVHDYRNLNIYDVLGDYLKVSRISKLEDINTELLQRMKKNTIEYKVKINKQD